MTDYICITCDGKGSVDKTRAATTTAEPSTMFTKYTSEQCGNCNGKGRLPGKS